MKHESKLTPREQQELAQALSQQSTAREFATVEEVIQADAAQSPVPPAVTERLNESIRQEPKPRSWWQRFTGR
jgi:hypothetical protein